MLHSFQDGVYDIPNDVYHGSYGLSRSALCEFKKSPWHYWNRYLNPDRTPTFTTSAMKLGELVHALVLEPERFDSRYAMKPSPIPMPKTVFLKDLEKELGKELGRQEFEKNKDDKESILVSNELMMKNFIAESGSKEILSIDMYLEAKRYADEVLKDSVAQALFTGTRVEQSIYFTHKETGLQCKVRPDAWAGGIVTDLKTCKDASYRAFQSSAYSNGYFIQAAMIKAALESLRITLEKFIFYCVEKSEQPTCVYYTLDEDALERGETEFNNIMYNIVHCMDTNDWHSYEPQSLTYPRWAQLEG